MRKNIDLKNRVVDLYEVEDSSLYEQEIVGFLDRKMKVRIHGALFNNNKYVFTGSPGDGMSGGSTITVSGYRKKGPGEENISVAIG